MRVITYRPGDVLRWTDRLGLDHDAIADDEGGVIRPVNGHGVIRQAMNEFDPEGRAAAVVMPTRRFDHRETLDRARGRLGDPRYSLIFANCQHFSSWCATGYEHSHQVDTVVAVATIAAGVVSVVKISAIAGAAIVAGATVAYLGGNAVFRRLAPADASAGAVVRGD
jgi:hypothetical protein